MIFILKCELNENKTLNSKWSKEEEYIPGNYIFYKHTVICQVKADNILTTMICCFLQCLQLHENRNKDDTICTNM